MAPDTAARRVALVQYGGGAVALIGVALMLLVSLWVGAVPFVIGVFLIDWPLFWKVNRGR